MSASRNFFAFVLSLMTMLVPANESVGAPDWKGLFEDAKTDPILIKPGSVSEKEFYATVGKWIRRNAIDPELERLKGSPDEAQLKPLVEFLGLFFSRAAPFGIPQEIRDQSVAVIRGKDRRPVVDFLCSYLIQNYIYDDAIHGFEAVSEAPADAPMPPIFRIYARAKMLSHANNLDKEKANSAQTEYYDALIPFLKSEFSEESALWTVYFFDFDAMSAVRWNREPRHIDLFMKSTLPEWARLTLAGNAHYKWGWNAGGRGWGTPKPNGEAIMAKQLAEARVKLTKAWELNPKAPFAATTMLRVAGVGKLEEGETLRLWLDRATAAVFDYPPAYAQFIQSSGPYWSGSFSQQMAFGKACAETKRYDSELPTVFNTMIYDIAAFVPDWTELFRNPEIRARILETRSKRAEKTIGTSDEMEHFSFLFVESWLCGDYAGANTALKRLANKDDFRISKAVSLALDKLNLNVPIVLRDTLLRGGPSSADYEKGVQAFSGGRYAEALKHFEVVKKTATPFSMLLLDAHIRLVQFQEQFAKGDWTPMPTDNWYCWFDLAGQGKWNPKNSRLRFTSDWEFSKFLFRGKLGNNFELRGKLDHSREPHPGGLAIFNGFPPIGAGRTDAFWWTLRVDCDGYEKSMIQWAPKFDAADDDKKLPRIKTNGGAPFVYRCENGKVTFSIGGKANVTKGKLGKDSPQGEGAFGFGVLGHGIASWSDVWALEVRMLDAK